MKKLIQPTLTLITLVALSACSYTSKPSTSQKDALESVSSDSHPKEKGSMQTALDNWVSQEWSPTVEKDEEIQKKYMKPETTPERNSAATKSEVAPTTTNAKVLKTEKKVKYVEDPDKPFTLQEYVDKAEVYRKAHEGDSNKPSHLDKMNKMPAIGN
jgi:hypothetical protein